MGLTVICLTMAEGAGRLVIRFLELKRPSGVFGEKILSHQEPMLGFGLKKQLNENMGGWTVTTNLHGFRDGEFTFAKPANEFRIIIVGGSTVFGWGVNEADTIPALLRDKLKSQTTKKIRVINAGIPWYASWHEAGLVFFKIIEMNPDWIISLDGLNDTAQGIAPNWEPVSRGFLDPPTRLAFQRLHSETSQRSFLAELLTISQTYTYFSSKIQSREAMNKGVYHPELWDQYVSLKEQIQSMTAAKGIRFTTFFQPVIVTGKILTEDEIRNNETNMRLSAFADSFRKTYLAGEEKALRSSKLRVFSLKDIFKNVRETIYVDGQHYNRRGNEIMASEIFKREILPQGESLGFYF